ncbi:MAG: hypothetical protein R6U20_08985 [Longimonas sp.]|uniref:hypothetical protein n=1 Tax=Longimonas sp. TaxID=2039626 RepID=UPI0039761DF1
MVGLLVLAGCGGDESGPAPSDLEGTYTFDRFEFTVAGVDNFNVLSDTLVTSDRSPRLEFFGGNATVNLVYRMEGSDGSSQISGQFSTRRNEVRVDFSQVAEENRRELLLPELIRFNIVDGGLRLNADQPRSEVDLNAYAPDRYAGLTQPVNGTLVLRLDRIAETPAAVWYDD